MEVDEDALDSDSGSDSGESGDDETVDDAVSDAQIADFEMKLANEPFNYAAHVGLIAALRAASDLDKLRTAREDFASKFPLSPALWLDYIKDEMMACLENDEDSRAAIERLFNRAMGDYQSIDIWLEYMQWACGGSLDDARKIFERALTAVGLQADKGALLWDLYREFEIAVFGTLSGPSADDQRLKIDKIFRRQLSVPLIGMEQTWMEYLEFLKETGSQPEAFVKKAYEKALERLSQIKVWEDSLETPDGASIEAFNNYLDAEVKEGDPARIQCLFERAVAINCLDTALWLRYVTWLDTKLKIHEVILPVYARAVRNCPWSTALWIRYLMSMERAGQSPEEIDAVWASATESGFSTSPEGIELFLAFTYLLKRRVEKNGGTDYSIAQQSFADGAARLQATFGERDWDPEASFRKCWAYFEATKCGNISKAREIWQDVLASGSGRFAAAWIEALALERRAGDVEHARKLLLRAVNSVSDYSEVVCQALLQFEREEGTLADLDVATARVDAQLARVAERRRQAGPLDGKEKRSAKKYQQQPAHHQPDAERQNAKAPPKGAERRSPQKRPAPAEAPATTEASPAVDKDGFTVPSAPFAPPTKKLRANEKDFEQTGKGEAKNNGGATSSSTEEKKGDANRTVFVSNLDFKVPEQRLRALFADVGEVAEIRLAKRPMGKLHKGFGYVEFASPQSIPAALKLDRTPIDGRPMFVSEYKPHEKGEHAEFKFGTGLEKNKLFVRNIHYDASKEEIEQLFAPYGKLTDVRIVVHKSGKSKGCAYVDFANEEDAKRALLATDGSAFHDRPLAVAYSNPPRKQVAAAPFKMQPAAGADPSARKGSSSKLQMTPRALATTKPKRSEATSAPTNATSTNSTSTTNGSSVPPVAAASHTAKLTNDQFREKFLKK